MGFPQLNFTGITEGIGRALSGLFSMRFGVPGLPSSYIPLWLIGLIIVVVVLVFQLRNTR